MQICLRCLTTQRKRKFAHTQTARNSSRCEQGEMFADCADFTEQCPFTTETLLAFARGKSFALEYWRDSLLAPATNCPTNPLNARFRLIGASCLRSLDLLPFVWWPFYRFASETFVTHSLPRLIQFTSPPYQWKVVRAVAQLHFHTLD